ncbi:MAG: MBL fold metallo-hydrolase [Acidobacteriota bacterium]|nr:MBL fold metallo-hydrolase [Acidobacteriota bacterium]
MIFQQFYLGCLAHASYIIGDEATGTALVVDPQRDVEQYLTFAAQHGLTIRYVFLTHLHADFIAGHLELRDRAGAEILLGAAAHAEYRFTPLADGEALEFGAVRLVALATPGHTTDSTSLLVYDLARSTTEPYAVLTGDTLFVGDVGRPDLHGSRGWTPHALGTMLYASLPKLMALPDATLVYPAHGAGSLCGKSLSEKTFSTIGEQRRTNYALQPMGQEEFIALVTADQPDAPAYFQYDAVQNTRERPTLEQTLERELHPLPLEQALALHRDGAQLLDVRDAESFAAAHLRGSINVGLQGQFATWAGTVLHHERPILIIADPGQEREAALRLGRIGFDNVAGYLQGGLQSLAASPALVATTERVDALLASERLGLHDAAAPLAVDVRTPTEHEQHTVPGSINLPLSQLATRLAELPPQRPLLVFCAGGYRSSVAASLLEQAGYAVSQIAGGIAGWDAARLPVTAAAG